VIGIGVIGYGYWGPNLVRNFAEAPGARVVVVCDAQPQRLKVAQARYPSVRTSTDYGEVLADPEVDAVVIATPVSSHFEMALEALRAGKHVLVEKPFAATVGQGQRLIDEAERRHLVLMVDHTFVFTGAVRKMREIIHDGLLGPVYYYDSVRVNLGLIQNDVNVLWDLAVHDLSIMDYVLGTLPRAVSAVGVTHVGRREDIAYLTCFFDANIIAHLHVNWLAPVKVRRTLVGGGNKMIVYDDLEPSEKVKIYDRGITLNGGQEGMYKLLVDYRMGDVWAPRLSTTEALTVEAAHFLECIEGHGQPLTDGQAGLRVVRILEAASESIAKGGQLIELAWEKARL
jgi:predicted dehydrogenase